MDHIIEKLRARALLALVPGLLFVVAAVLPSGASATVVTPASTAAETKEITATNSGNTVFDSANAYAEESVQCKNSTAKFTTPNGELVPAESKFRFNTNQKEVGTFSTGSGSVKMLLKEPPKFENCAVYARVGGAWVETEVGAKVEARHQWTLSATNNTASTGVLAIAVPAEGATINIGNSACVLTVPPAGEADSVNSVYLNLRHEAEVDGQIDFTSTPPGCGGPSPAQFEAIYTFNGGFEIN